MAVSESVLNDMYNEVRDTRSQMVELQQKMKQQSDDFQRDIEDLSKRMQESTVNAQNEIIRRWQEQEAEMCRNYTLEVEAVREEYKKLLDDVKKQEAEYEKALQDLERERKEERAKIEWQNDRTRTEAMKQAEALKNAFMAAEKEPVEIFFPHKLANYKQAGERAAQFMAEGLYVLAANDYSICCLGVENLMEDTRTKVNDIHTMFTLFRAMLSRIQILQDEAWVLKDDNGEECLALETAYDKEYWSDLLYTELNRNILEYRRIADDGEDAWIRSSVGKEASPELLLDRKIRSLEYIPNQLQVCINYALSACDSYNALNSIFTGVNQVMCDQNYLFTQIAYGSCRDGNNHTDGYRYYRRWLDEEECMDPAREPDYRETRCMQFRNLFGYECRIYMIPVRSENHVGYRLFLESIQEYLPANVQVTLQRVLSSQLQQEVLPYDADENRRLYRSRIMTMDELKVLAAVPSEEKLKAKYCVGL